MKPGTVLFTRLHSGVASALEVWARQGTYSSAFFTDHHQVLMMNMRPEHFTTEVIVRYTPPRAPYEPGPVPGSLW